MGVIAKETLDHMGIEVSALLIECPNQECKAQTFSISAVHAERRIDNLLAVSSGDEDRPVGIGTFTFLPATAHPLSKHVPNHIVEDYNEAFLISNLSPKASATLARRALQGMVRDFFKVKGKKTLHQELEAIQDQCDPDLYEAMMGVKSIGNIGAHPEQDVNLIVDVEPGEADALLKLIHLLDREWYVARADRQTRIEKMKALADGKAAARAGGAAPLGGAQ